MINQKSDNLHVSMERREVQGCKSIVSRTRLIYPRFQFVASLTIIVLPFFKNEFSDDKTRLVHVLIRCVVDGCVAALVMDRRNIKRVSALVQVLLELLKVHPLDVLVNQLLLVTFLCHV